jgi:CxxC motif-containing protein
MTKRELTCIVCPRGCQLTVELDGKNVLSVSGNICKRGKTYAENECINPMRTVTTTAKTSDGGVVAVKTETAIPKDKMLECMEIINNIVVELPARVGDVIAEDVFGSRIVVTQNREDGAE